jgi:hypothetical protein
MENIYTRFSKIHLSEDHASLKYLQMELSSKHMALRWADTPSKESYKSV